MPRRGMPLSPQTPLQVDGSDGFTSSYTGPRLADSHEEIVAHMGSSRTMAQKLKDLAQQRQQGD